MKWNTEGTLTISMLDVEDIKRLRGAKNAVDPFVPYHFLQEQEVNAQGVLQQVNTIFLTSRECPFQCLMCDLWKNTLDGTTPEGAIAKQIAFALEHLPPAQVIKLYNSGNFFDNKAVPLQDYREIAVLLDGYERIIVENHPSLCGDLCLRFNNMLGGKLEIAMGLETVHPEALSLLNKKLTVEDFKDAARFLTDNGIDVRTFVLLNPPFVRGENENIEWALRSIRFAFESGSTCCSIIPTRTGNGIMEKLQREKDFVSPSLEALEEVFDRGLSLQQGRVFVDLWDLEKFSDCPECFDARRARLIKMNLEQRVYPRISCPCDE